MGISELFELQDITAKAESTTQIDINYEGPLDPFTGEPLTREDAASATTVITNGSSYDFNRNMFVYALPGGSGELYSTVADGMVTTQQVTLSYDEESAVRVYRDGVEIEKPFAAPLTLFGSYSVAVDGNDTQTQLLGFTIVGKKTGELSAYHMPSGFMLTNVAFNKEYLTVTDTSEVELKEEGEYAIAYRCASTGIVYNLDLQIDHTPPAFTLEGVENGLARGPVTVVGVENSDMVSMTFNGESDDYKQTGGKLTMPGEYTLTVTDDAGNSVTEEFTILMYLNAQGLWFGILFLAVLVAAIAYVIVTRKRLRIQ